jgi:hypothetical protein
MAAAQSFLQRMRDVYRRTLLFSSESRLMFVKSQGSVERNLHQESVKWQHTVKNLWLHFNARLTTMSTLFARQCHAIAAQRVRRAVQIAALYGNLGYDRRTVQTVVEKIGGAFIARLPKYHLMLGLTMFAWQKDGISDEELTRLDAEVR